MAVLVTGGAGYIGSHVVWALLDADEQVCVLDDFSTGARTAVPSGGHWHLVEGDAGDLEFMRTVLRGLRIEAVIHFAGMSADTESVADPLKYYRNNTAASRNLIEACVREGVGKFIYPSTAAVYGFPQIPLLREDAPLRPRSPSAISRMMTELMLRDAARAYPFRYVVLRHFNVAGADPLGRAGPDCFRATDLVTVACQAALGLRRFVEVFGTDFLTPDGTGVRDYVHVSDVAEAHRLALDHLRAGAGSLTLNCGCGQGYSVRDVIRAVMQVSGVEFEVRDTPRRSGDAAQVVADCGRLRDVLGWKPRYNELYTIVRHALLWESKMAALATMPLPAH